MTLTICPTAPQRVFYDEHVSAKRMFAVSSHSVADGSVESTGLSYEDYSRMTTQKKKLFSGRRTTVPEWATNNNDLQKVLVAYLEARANVTPDESLPLLERLRRAEQKMMALAPKTEHQLDKLCARYVDLQRNGGTREELEALQRVINGVDTKLIVNRSPAKIAAAVVYKYYREGMKSTQIAADLGLNSPGVRQLVLRIQKTALSLGYPPPEQTTCYRVRRRRSVTVSQPL